MKIALFKQSLALLLSLEIGLAPALAHARGVPQPQFPKVSELGSDTYTYRPAAGQAYDAMIERGELPNFSEDDLDPVGIRGQYARIYDRKGNIIDQYFFDELNRNRKAPNYSQIRPRLVENERGQKCLVIEATAGEDSHGKNGYVVGRLFAPRFCGLVGVHLDKEVLSLVHEDGAVTFIDWAYVRARGFRNDIWGAVKAFVPEVEGGLKGHEVTITAKTPGMRPIDWSNAVEGAVIPRDDDNEPSLADGDLVILRDGRFYATVAYTTSRKMLYVEQIRVLMAVSMANGTIDDMKILREALEDLKRRSDLYDQLMTTNDDFMVNPAVAAMINRMDPAARRSFNQSVEAFRVHIDREQFPYSNQVHDKLYVDIVDSAVKMAAAGIKIPVKDQTKAYSAENIDPEYLRTHWPELLKSKFQTIDQRIETINEPTSKKFASQIWEHKTMALALAAFGAWMYLPNAIEQSPFLQRFAFINWIYHHSPDVLKVKHLAYRNVLYASVASLTLMMFLPDTLSALSGVVLKTLNKATLRSKSAFAQYVRDLTRYWGDQSNWQRLATFGAQFGSKVAVTPIIRIVEDLLQQKAFLSAIKAGQTPWKTVHPADPLGQYLGLTEPQTVGLMRPSLKGVFKSLHRLIPGISDPAAEAWQAARLKGKQRLQAEIYYRNQRRRQYARLLATLIIAQDEGVEAADIRLLLEQGVARGGLTAAQVHAYVTRPRALEDHRLMEHKLYKEMKDLAHDFNHDASYREIDVAEMLRYGGRAKEILISLRNNSEFRRFTQIVRLNAKEAGVNVLVETLSQGQALAEANVGLIANEDVWKNMKEQFPPDHLMVSDVPAVAKIPGLPNRTDFTHPDQLAADINGSWANLWTTGVHIQDVAFNFIMQGLQGPAMTMRQFQQREPETEGLYRSWQDVVNLVMARRDGKLTLVLPEKTNNKSDRYEGYIQRQSFGEALRDYGKALKSIDFGHQARRGMQTMHETFWLYFTMQLAARSLVGGQAWGPAILGILFAFQASQVCYKPIWWVVNPTNNDYYKIVGKREKQFEEGRRWLQVAETMPDGERKKALQEKGIDRLQTIFEERKPEVYTQEFGKYRELRRGRLDLSLDEMAKAHIKLADEVSPGGLMPNGKMTSSVNIFAAFATTFAAIPMFTVSNVPGLMSKTFVLATSAVSYAWQTFAIYFLGHDPRARKFVKRQVGNAVAKVASGCEAALTAILPKKTSGQ